MMKSRDAKKRDECVEYLQGEMDEARAAEFLNELSGQKEDEQMLKSVQDEEEELRMMFSYAPRTPRSGLPKSQVLGRQRGDWGWWLQTVAAGLLVTAAALWFWQPWRGLDGSKQVAGEKDGEQVAEKPSADDELKLVVKGPFANRTPVAFEKSDSPFVEPLSVEVRDESKATRLRVSFRFKGTKDLAKGMRVGLTRVHQEQTLKQERVCADGRFLTDLPLWAKVEADSLKSVAVFDLPKGVREDLTQLDVRFSSVRVPESAKAKPLTKADWRRAIALIAELDDEEFKTRDVAHGKLVDMGESIRPYLEMLFLALAERPDGSLQLKTKLQAVATAITNRKNAVAERERERRRAKARAEILALLKEIKEGKRHAYHAPTPGLRKALEKKTSFEFVDTPLVEALKFVETVSGATIVADPAALTAVPPAINLRVTDMSCSLALRWILRLADLNYVLHGDAVVVVRRKAALHPLSSDEQLLVLPVEPGAPPWTEEELKRLCQFYELTEFKITSDNQARVAGNYQKVADLAKVLPSFGKPVPMPSAEMPQWVVQVEKKLDARVNLEANLSAADALKAIRRQTAVTIDSQRFPTQIPEALSKFLSKRHENRTARDVLGELSVAAGLKLRLCRYDDDPDDPPKGFVTFNEAGIRYSPVILPISEALKKDVSKEGLHACLKRVLEGLPGSKERQEAADPAKMTIRGRWLLKTDLWTKSRLVKVLNETIRTKGVPDVPPLPWFMEAPGP